ncbi:beta-hydroxyacyl-ACP dehydratase, partial [Clostridia bacterium OttesenSCG-928-F22]|nr:beta-hydroxyacyl-ACP dehydratase [Clostridia bacterium OttesenSCG-928-F22]
DPFLFVDEVTALIPRKRAEGKWHLAEDFYAFKGHFPGTPMLPGVLMVEAISQLGAFVILSEQEFAGKLPLFAGANNIKFRHAVKPGDTVHMEVELTRLSHLGGRGWGKAYVDSQLACEAETSFVFIDA